MNDNVSFYAAGARGYKMPELDCFLAATSQAQADLFEAKEVQSIEGGIKTQIGNTSVTLSGFYTSLKNLIGQGLETVGGVTTWVVRTSPDNRSFGAELEAVVNPVEGLMLQGNATVLEGELGGGVDTLASRTGVQLALTPRTVGNVVALYTVPGPYGLQLKADWHWVASRFSEDAVTRPLDNPGPPGLQLLQLRRRHRNSTGRSPGEHRSAERIPEQGAGGRQPATVSGGWCSHLPGPAAAAPAAASVDQLRLRRVWGLGRAGARSVSRRP